MSNEQSIRDEIIDMFENAQEHARRIGFVATPVILADALLASPVIRRIQAEALREVSWKYILECRNPADVRDMIRAEADRIERGETA